MKHRDQKGEGLRRELSRTVESGWSELIQRRINSTLGVEAEPKSHGYRHETLRLRYFGYAQHKSGQAMVSLLFSCKGNYFAKSSDRAAGKGGWRKRRLACNESDTGCASAR